MQYRLQSHYARSLPALSIAYRRAIMMVRADGCATPVHTAQLNKHYYVTQLRGLYSCQQHAVWLRITIAGC
jgi:hypothetical protein